MIVVFTMTLDVAGQGMTEDDLRDEIKMVVVHFVLLGAYMGICSATGQYLHLLLHGGAAPRPAPAHMRLRIQSGGRLCPAGPAGVCFSV